MKKDLTFILYLFYLRKESTNSPIKIVSALRKMMMQLIEITRICENIICPSNPV